jgi:hypothetical protein
MTHPRTSPNTVRALLTGAHCSVAELASELGIDSETLAQYADTGGPAWLHFALIGVAVHTYGWPAEEVCACFPTRGQRIRGDGVQVTKRGRSADATDSGEPDQSAGGGVG